MFEDLQHQIEAELPPSEISPQELGALRREFPGLPEDYLTFLKELGWGEMGPFRLYSGPIEARLEYPWLDQALETVLLIGDDMQGYAFGYDTAKDFRLVQLDPRGKLRNLEEETFGEWARARFEAARKADEEGGL